MELAPNLHRVGNDIIAAYLVADESGITVIDAGLVGHWNDLVRELDTMGRTLSDIRGVVLTHGDSDHIGFAERLRRELGVPVYVHEADAARARGEEKSHPAWGRMRPGATLRFLAYSIRKGGMRTTPLTAVTPVQAGDTLPLPGNPRVIALPGHSAGSIAVHVAAVDAVFVGDALTTRHVLTGRAGAQPAPFTDDPAEAHRSLKRLASIDASWVLPGHGTPSHDGTATVVEQIERSTPQRG